MNYVNFNFSRVQFENNEILAVKCNQYVEMLSGNVLAPYAFKTVSIIIDIIIMIYYITKKYTYS